MTLGVIGKKLGMTQIFDEQGLAIPVTVIKVDETVVTQVKTVETDGYNAIQVGTVPAKEKHLTKAQLGHFKKNNLSNYRHLQEFRVENPQDYKVGDKMSVVINSVDADNERISLRPASSIEQDKTTAKYLDNQDDSAGETYNPFAALLKK